VAERHLKWGEGKGEGLGAVPAVKSRGKAHGGSVGGLPPKADDTFCESADQKN